uniref:Uncharacterized protein n=1 Tax=Trichobilharzia regenti TaxID=157069 RepID=A0AA85KCR5_TRIRE|nr:unnamed protein product [Trichobilharzia regenti]
MAYNFFKLLLCLTAVERIQAVENICLITCNDNFYVTEQLEYRFVNNGGNNDNDGNKNNNDNNY